MTKLSNLFEAIVVGIVKRLPPEAVLALAGVIYIGLGLVLPITLNWPTYFLVTANVIAVLLAWIFFTVSIVLVFERSERWNLLEWTSDIYRLNSNQFEWLVGEVFHRQGWQVNQTGRVGFPDGNIDLDLKRNGERLLVECKRWTSQAVGVHEIRLFLGALAREKIDGDSGVFVTLSHFTPSAEAEASQAGLRLIDRKRLLLEIEQVRRAEPCPKCAAPMVLDRSSYGWWLHCVAAPCSGKRDLGDTPHEALELLIKRR